MPTNVDGTCPSLAFAYPCKHVEASRQSTTVQGRGIERSSMRAAINNWGFQTFSLSRVYHLNLIASPFPCKWRCGLKLRDDKGGGKGGAVEGKGGRWSSFVCVARYGNNGGVHM